MMDGAINLFYLKSDAENPLDFYITFYVYILF